MTTPTVSVACAPEPLLLDGDATATITIRNTGKPVRCQQVTVTVVPGSDARALVPDNQLDRIHFQRPSQYWKSKPDGHGKFVLVTSRDSPIPDPMGKEFITFVAQDLRVNKASGETTITVEARFKGVNEPLTKEASVVKFTETFHLENFRPDQTVVLADENVTLRWSSPKDIKSEGVTLKLEPTRAPLGYDDVTTLHWWAGPIIRDTAFTLTATKEIKGQSTVSTALHTFATVALPYFEVSNLVVDDCTTLLTAPDTSVPLAPDPVDTSTPIVHEYTAETDGLLVGSLQALTATAVAELSIVVTPRECAGGEPTPDAQHTTSIRARGANDAFAPCVPITVVVPANADVKATWSLVESAKNQDVVAFAADLRWQPLGIGALHRV